MDIEHNLGNNSYVIYKPKLFEHLLEDGDFDELWDLHPTEYGQVKMYGKIIDTPRWQQSYGVPYYFSGMDHPALEFPNIDTLQILKEYVESVEGCEYKQMLMNWYETGSHYIGKHSDNERLIIPQSNIYSFSFGAERVFRIRGKKHTSVGDKPQLRLDLAMPHGTLIVMGGDMQKHFTHEVPKSTKVKERRINITFRRFISSSINAHEA